MSNRHFAKVLSVMDGGMAVVIDKGRNDGVSDGDIFTIVGLGDTVVDRETGQEYERLELLRGRAKAVHVQEGISTLESMEISRAPTERRTIYRDQSRSSTPGTSYGIGRVNSFLGRGIEEREEVEKSGEVKLRPLNRVVSGDFAIKGR
ncbi:hypothetical protein FEE59_22120 [Herbaspirillum sp. RU 5E]|nr:hypothetical protein [Herbaspirillum sp. RU 5E]